MRLPALSVIVFSQFVIWCIVGVAAHGPMILVYPASWMVIGAAFFLHMKKYPITPPEVSSADAQWANSGALAHDGMRKSGKSDPSNPPQVAAADWQSR